MRAVQHHASPVRGREGSFAALPRAGSETKNVTLALVRGDHQLNLQKLQDGTGAIDIRPATPEEAKAVPKVELYWVMEITTH